MLAIDGLQPDVGHEVLWVLRDVLSGEVLLARALLGSGEEQLVPLFQEIVQALGDDLPILGVIPSMSRKSNLYDNARMESFYKILKSEEVDLQDYLDPDDAQQHLDRFIGDL